MQVIHDLYIDGASALIRHAIATLPPERLERIRRRLAAEIAELRASAPARKSALSAKRRGSLARSGRS